jgi:hypothetical protein
MIVVIAPNVRIAWDWCEANDVDKRMAVIITPDFGLVRLLGIDRIESVIYLAMHLWPSEKMDRLHEIENRIKVIEAWMTN